MHGADDTEERNYLQQLRTTVCTPAPAPVHTYAPNGAGKITLDGKISRLATLNLKRDPKMAFWKANCTGTIVAPQPPCLPLCPELPAL